MFLAIQVIYLLMIFYSSDGQNIPIIDISEFVNGSDMARREIANKMGDACKKFEGLSTKEFFDLDTNYKNKFETTSQHNYPFGYCPLGGEVLKLSKSAEKDLIGKSSHNDESLEISETYPDMKEMFSLGPSNPLSGFPPRIFPDQPPSFKSSWTTYYSNIENLAHTILSILALALDLPNQTYFDQYLDHHASAIRALNYPELSSDFIPKPGQVRASAHTDYGAITILRTDGPGLQVSKDVDPPTWVDVPYIKDGFVINLGDLMRRWTDDYWLSTLHRVIIPNQELSTNCNQDVGSYTCTVPESQKVPSVTDRRQSIAFFVNVNPDASISTLPSPVIDEYYNTLGREQRPSYEPIIAGDFLLLKHIAAQKKDKQ